MKKLILAGAIVIAMLSVSGLQYKAQAGEIDGCSACYKKKNGQLRLVSSLSKCLKSEKPINLCQAYNPTYPGDFVGTWTGSGSTEGRVVNLTLTIGTNGESTFVTEQPTKPRTDTHSFSVTDVVNGTLSYALPVSDLDNGHPDCINWNVQCTSTLDSAKTTMTQSCEGTICGSGGGQPYSWTLTLSKQ